MSTYDRIGAGYSGHRSADGRWAALIADALGTAERVLDVGAGTGSYEPSDRMVLAVEPSTVMIGQRPVGAAPVLQATAEALPVGDGSCDASLAVLTTHHWNDPAAGLAELRRVAPRQVVVTWDPALFAERFWLVKEYVPDVLEHEAGLATLRSVTDHLEVSAVTPLPVPADCTDGFFGAYWCRPDAYLDPAVRGAISGLALLDPEVVAAAFGRLEADLAGGRWHRQHSDLLARDELDLGYRLVVAGD